MEVLRKSAEILYQLISSRCPRAFKQKIRKLKNKITDSLAYDVESIIESRNSNRLLKLGNAIGENGNNKIAKSIIENRILLEKKSGKLNISEDELIDTLRDKKAVSKSVNEWENTYDALLMSGMYDSACIVRRNIKRKLYSQKNAYFKYKLHKVFSASIEDRNKNVTKKVTNKLIRHPFLSRRARNKYEFYFQLVFGGKDDGVEKAYFSERDWEMLDYVQGRSVAIVGPSVILEGKAEEIDAHDIVVRFNSTSDDIGERRGDKIDVVYCTGAVTKKIAEGKLGHPDTADWLVSRASEGVSEIHDSGSIHARMAILQNVFFHGVPNMVPLALFDILNFSPSRVSIYGTNLYISSRLYSDDYVTDNKSVTSARMVQSFASHDSLANFKFMKNMFELGYFDPSQQLEAVLQNTDREYMRLLKRLHVEQKPVELEHV